MKILISLAIFLTVFFTSHIHPVWAITNPSDVDNNRLGAHILDPNELEHAAKIVNANHHDWGYVIVPLRVDDRDLDKWFSFFLKCRQLKVIPIVRLAMHAENTGWAVPTDSEILYAANFLNQMPWPVQNRYIIVFNEPNHALEWGGLLDPTSYAERLNFAIDVFKSMNQDFFMLPAALDRAAPNGQQTMKADTYLHGIFASRPELIYKIDGWNSHAYPNPAFSASPNDRGLMSITSYRQELAYLQHLGRDNLPLFVTETNWSNQNLTDSQISAFWQQAWENAWTDRNLILVSAWLVHASDGPFQAFSLTDNSFQPNLIGQTIAHLNRQSGSPVLSPELKILTASTESTFDLPISPSKTHDLNLSSFWQRLKTWILPPSASQTQPHLPTLMIGKASLNIEIADNPQSQALGLGYRTSLPINNGMLFVYDQPGHYTFWMKETLIPLDIIWINNGQVVDITSNIPVDSNPSEPKGRYSPQTLATWVLETNANWATQNHIQIGDAVVLNK